MSEAKKIDDGGAAFPSGNRDMDGNWESLPGDPGMSLRDAAALTAFNQMLRWEFAEGSLYEEIAEQSFMAADAWLTARKGGSDD